MIDGDRSELSIERSLRSLGETALANVRIAVDSAGSFRAIADVMPQLVWTAQPDGTVDYFNWRWIEYTGLTLDDVGQKGREAGVVHPEDLAETWARWDEAVATASPYEREYRLRNAADGGYRWFLSRAVPLRDDDGNVRLWIGTATDIDEQRRSRDSLSFLVETANAFSTALQLDAICNALAEITIGHFADWCFVSLVRPGGPVIAALAHRNHELREYVRSSGAQYPVRPGDPLAKVISENQPMLFERILPADLENAARNAEHLKLLRKLNMCSAMILPLAGPSGRIHGALSIVSSESRRIFSASDLDVATAVAARAAVAIENAQILAEERRISRRLRFTGKTNDLLFDASDFWKTMERIADMVATEIADACAVVRLTGDAVRVETAVHRDPAANAVISHLQGQRPLRPDAERELAAHLRNHETVVRHPDDLILMKDRVWPYLAKEIEALNSKATVVVPLQSGGTTYGALVVSYSQRSYEGERDLPLLQEIAARASVAVERVETLERERRIATTLQQASLPSLIPQPPGLHFDAVYSPAGDEAEVGGDWYDAIELDDGSVVVSVGDVTGRGIQAAAIMSKVRHAMGMAPRHEKDPAKILDSAEWFLRKRYPDAIVTAFVAVIAADRRSLQFANAGHPLPILRRDGHLMELEASGLPLGLRHLGASETSKRMDLCDGDLLVLYTDGLTEWNRNWVEGEGRLAEICRTEAIAVSTASAHLIERACLPGRSHDDVAIFTVSVGPGSLWSFAAEDARAAADARQLFMAFLRGRTQNAAFLLRAELVFGELLGNVVRHAPGPVEIELLNDDGALVLHVIDSGPRFDVSNRLPSNILSELGRGLFIIQQLAPRVTVERVPDYGNHVMVTI